VSVESIPSNQPPSERHAQWHRIEADVADLRDGLGLEIDPAIRPLVVALKAHGFGTTASCEGHSDRAKPYPWVDVESQLAEELLRDERYLVFKQKSRSRHAPTTPREQEEANRLVDQLVRANRETWKRLTAVLNEFYETTQANRVSGASHLTIQQGPWYQSRLQPADIPFDPSGKDLSESWPAQTKNVKLADYRREMQRFAAFLKTQYFANETSKTSGE
jgi:hypothetical protein